MRVLVKAKNLQVTPAIKAAVERQAQKFYHLTKHIRQISALIEVVDKKKNDMQAAKVTFRIDWVGQSVVVARHATDLYDAIVDTAEHAQRALRKCKEKHYSRKQMKLQAPIVAVEEDS